MKLLGDSTTPGTPAKAVDVRREMVPAVSDRLAPVDRMVFVASTKVAIADIEDGELVQRFGRLFRYIAIDVGYNIPTNPEDLAYITTRLVDVLKRYYGGLTLEDVKLAFELALTGELDEFLPRDSQGNPDRKHYQNFNVDYLAKILNAYRKKQNVVIDKAYNSLPQKRIVKDSDISYYQKQIVRNCIITFLRYKYTGLLEFTPSGEMLIYDWLLSAGYANPVAITPDDRNQALQKYLIRAARGLVNQYEAFHVRRAGSDAKELDFTAYECARKKEIQRTFDRMIAAELQIITIKRFIAI